MNTVKTALSCVPTSGSSPTVVFHIARPCVGKWHNSFSPVREIRSGIQLLAWNLSLLESYYTTRVDTICASLNVMIFYIFFVLKVCRPVLPVSHPSLESFTHGSRCPTPHMLFHCCYATHKQDF